MNKPMGLAVITVASSGIGATYADRVMPAEDMVNASLSGRGQDEFVTILALPDAGQWQTYKAQRQALLPKLCGAKPVDKYATVREGR